MFKFKPLLSIKLILPLMIITPLMLTQSYSFTMMGLTTFFLAYLSKGMRRRKNKL
jgi:hypothetical protein